MAHYKLHCNGGSGNSYKLATCERRELKNNLGVFGTSAKFQNSGLVADRL